MGLFQHRPEEPTEWAGLPSEPLHSKSEAEMLEDAAPVDAGFGGLFVQGTAIESIEIPVEVESEESEESEGQ
ncbi:hypothetical protein GCM10022200_07500 [Microbacterium awajiense]|uniref:Uncharacterized protein n=1 Tax=Microbacterium awajiense TaxID=415214 RepID=A0ABP7A9L3_9MICO